jgi:hypothetical protein
VSEPTQHEEPTNEAPSPSMDAMRREVMELRRSVAKLTEQQAAMAISGHAPFAPKGVPTITCGGCGLTLAYIDLIDAEVRLRVGGMLVFVQLTERGHMTLTCPACVRYESVKGSEIVELVNDVKAGAEQR